MIVGFPFIVIREIGNYSIILKKNGELFKTTDPEYLEIIQSHKRNYVRTYNNGFQWIQLRPNPDFDLDRYLIIVDDFGQPLEYLISNQYNITDRDTIKWLDLFQDTFIGYQPDIYENISQDSFS